MPDILSEKEKQIANIGKKTKTGEQEDWYEKKKVLAEPCVPGQTASWKGKAYVCNAKGRWEKEGKKFTLPDQDAAQGGIDRIFGEEK